MVLRLDLTLCAAMGKPAQPDMQFKTEILS
jgi:hypothetical protein